MNGTEKAPRRVICRICEMKQAEGEFCVRCGRNLPILPSASVHISCTNCSCLIQHFPTIEAMERSLIEAAMTVAKGDKMTAAKMLGLGKTTLYRKLHEYSARSQEAFMERKSA